MIGVANDSLPDCTLSPKYLISCWQLLLVAPQEHKWKQIDGKGILIVRDELHLVSLNHDEGSFTLVGVVCAVKQNKLLKVCF